MKRSDTATDARFEELRQRLEQLDAERTAISAELHRLTGASSATPAVPSAPNADPISVSDPKDWHVFAGLPKPTPPKA